MNFTSQICTTKEQSERLLALGLKKETADMTYLNNKICAASYNEMECPYDNLVKPAWSLHRLLEMMPTYIDVVGDEWTLNILQGKLIAYTTDEKENFLFAQGAISLYDSIIAAIEWLIQAGHFNEEYLKKL